MNDQRENANTSRDENGMNANEAVHMQRAARRLDAETAAIDATTLAALARARRDAAASRQQQWLPLLGWGGLGVALAASLTALLVLPVYGPASAPPADAVFAQLTAIDAEEFGEIALTDDSETALTDDLAFIAWLDENHDAG